MSRNSGSLSTGGVPLVMWQYRSTLAIPADSSGMDCVIPLDWRSYMVLHSWKISKNREVLIQPFKIVLLLRFTKTICYFFIYTWSNRETQNIQCIFISLYRLFVTPFYIGPLIIPSMILNRRMKDLRHQTFQNNMGQETNSTKYSNEDPEYGSKHDGQQRDDDDGPVPMIYACATMWHETRDEMLQLLKSLFRYFSIPYIFFICYICYCYHHCLPIHFHTIISEYSWQKNKNNKHIYLLVDKLYILKRCHI